MLSLQVYFVCNSSTLKLVFKSLSLPRKLGELVDPSTFMEPPIRPSNSEIVPSKYGRSTFIRIESKLRSKLIESAAGK